MEQAAEITARPYASAALGYYEHGWTSPLPLPAARKSPPPEGFTGWDGDTPSYADVQAWTEDRPKANIGLRMPPGVLGIDTDQYGTKHGRYTRLQCEDKWGKLPPTWRSTSRDDKVSGIDYFRVPEGLEWPGVLPGGDVETIHFGHRYAVVAPSVHPEGRPYFWLDPSGQVSDEIPNIDQLPPLPASWLIGLGARPHTHQARADLGTSDIVTFISGLPGSTHAACEGMAKRAAQAAADVHKDTGSRHDTCRDHTLALIRMAEQGHVGISAALERVRSAFIATVVGDSSRTPREAFAEWQRIHDGAVRIVVGNPELTLVEGDPCGPVMANLSVPPRTTVSHRVPDGPDTVSVQVSATNGSTVSDRVPTVSEARSEAELRALRALLAPSDTPAPPTVEHSSWWGRDITAALADEDEETPPGVLQRMDGQCAFYSGEVNGILGASESGKTWVALLACAQAIQSRRSVIYFDFENSPKVIVSRLKALGLLPEEIEIYFTYVQPEEAFTERPRADVVAMMSDIRPVLAVVDGVNAAMGLSNLELKDNKDAITFNQKLLRPLASEEFGSPAVAYVDHIPKNNPDSAGGIGAQAKRAMTTGCCLKVEVVQTFGRGLRGELRITVDKDRLGFVRGVSVREGEAMVFATAEFTSSGDGKQVGIKLVGGGQGGRPAVSKRYTGLMERISRLLETMDAPISQAAIIREKFGKQENVIMALNALVREAYATRTVKGSGYGYSIARVYREETDPLAERFGADPFGSGYPVQDPEEDQE